MDKKTKTIKTAELANTEQTSAVSDMTNLVKNCNIL